MGGGGVFPPYNVGLSDDVFVIMMTANMDNGIL